MSSPSGTLHSRRSTACLQSGRWPTIADRSLDSRDDGRASSDRPAGQGMQIKRTRQNKMFLPSPSAIAHTTTENFSSFVAQWRMFGPTSSPSHVAIVVQRLSLADARDKAMETAMTLPTQASRSVQEAVVEVVRGAVRLDSGSPCHRRTPEMCELLTSRWKVYRRMCC